MSNHLPVLVFARDVVLGPIGLFDWGMGESEVIDRGGFCRPEVWFGKSLGRFVGMSDK